MELKNNWFLLTMTYNGSVFKIYKDNTEVYSANSTFETPTENFFELEAQESILLRNTSEKWMTF
jgi:hypothetical protein